MVGFVPADIAAGRIVASDDVSIFAGWTGEANLSPFIFKVTPTRVLCAISTYGTGPSATLQVMLVDVSTDTPVVLQSTNMTACTGLQVQYFCGVFQLRTNVFLVRRETYPDSSTFTGRVESQLIVTVTGDTFTTTTATGFSDAVVGQTPIGWCFDPVNGYVMFEGGGTAYQCVMHVDAAGAVLSVGSPNGSGEGFSITDGRKRRPADLIVSQQYPNLRLWRLNPGTQSLDLLGTTTVTPRLDGQSLLAILDDGTFVDDGLLYNTTTDLYDGEFMRIFSPTGGLVEHVKIHDLDVIGTHQDEKYLEHAVQVGSVLVAWGTVFDYFNTAGDERDYDQLAYASVSSSGLSEITFGEWYTTWPGGPTGAVQVTYAICELTPTRSVVFHVNHINNPFPSVNDALMRFFAVSMAPDLTGSLRGNRTNFDL